MKLIRIGNVVVDRDRIVGMRFHLYNPNDNSGVEMTNSYELYIDGGFIPAGGSIYVSGSYEEIKPEVDAFLSVLGLGGS
jgi:hypothetical protein